jgi:hypothetical protein
MYIGITSGKEPGDRHMNTIQAVVRNGKIEITAPSEIRDGETVSVLVIGHSAAEEAMSDEEITRTLKAMDEFNAAFPAQESGEDLSQSARIAGDFEKKAFAENADKLKRLFD